MHSANAPSALRRQSSRSPRAAASCAARKRSLNARSKASSFLNQRNGPASRQNAITSPGEKRIDAVTRGLCPRVRQRSAVVVVLVLVLLLLLLLRLLVPAPVFLALLALLRAAAGLVA